VVDNQADRFLNVLVNASGDQPVSVHSLCAGAVALLPVSGASVTLTGEGATQVVATSLDGLARELQDLEFTLGEGPSVEATRDGRPVVVGDLASVDGRWPEFAPAAMALGVRAIFALPLHAGERSVGILTLCRDRPMVTTAAQYGDALLVASLVTDLLLTLQSDAASESLAFGLDVYDHRAVVHQATGIVAVQLRCGVDEALVRLRGYAFATDRPVDDVAKEVVQGHLRFDEV
jgi:GAF domain-containing protein